MSRSSGSRRSRKRQLQASHQKNWLIGRHAVVETLTAQHWPVDELFLSEELANDVVNEVAELAEQADVNWQMVPAARVSELCHAEHHQGMAARMGPFPYTGVESLLGSCSAELSDATTMRSPIVVVCDRIQDTFNFGAILRCCDAMNVAGVVIGAAEQAAVTPQVARSSAGAVNYVPIVMSDSVINAVGRLTEAGFAIAAASEKSESVAWDADLKRPIALIVGSEARGVSDELLERCDLRLRIPMMGQVDSLNAAVATGMLLYEIRRQQV